MQALNRLTRLSSSRLSQKLIQTLIFAGPQSKTLITTPLSTKRTNSKADDEWDTAWETAWLPDDLAGKQSVPWESEFSLGMPPSSSSHSSGATTELRSDADAETKALVEEMNENWDQRKGRRKNELIEDDKKKKEGEASGSLYDLENIKKDYRLKKQRVHAGLWMKEIERLEEAKLGESGFGGAGDDIEKLLDSCSDIFDSANDSLGNSKVPTSSEFKNKPDGWETMSKTEDGNVWDMSQREEDILLQEFERRMAFCKFQIASFIKSHIFSRRRPVDGWKYMIEEIGPNAKKGKGSTPRAAGLADPATQPFREDMNHHDGNRSSFKQR